MKNLLIVDDEIEIANSLSEYFSEKGFSVSTCAAVDEALDFYLKKKPDLILSDIKMTGYSDITGVEKAFDMGIFKFDMLQIY